jgi:hypothetical protein
MRRFVLFVLRLLSPVKRDFEFEAQVRIKSSTSPEIEGPSEKQL